MMKYLDFASDHRASKVIFLLMNLEPFPKGIVVLLSIRVLICIANVLLEFKFQINSYDHKIRLSEIMLGILML